MNIFIIIKEQEGYSTYVVFASFDEAKADAKYARLKEENTDNQVQYSLQEFEEVTP